MSNSTVRVEHDDDQIDVMQKASAALEAHGLRFRLDGLTHDGYDIWLLEPLPPTEDKK